MIEQWENLENHLQNIAILELVQMGRFTLKA